MKNILLFSIVAVCCVFVSCKKKSSGGSPYVSMSADVRNIPWISYSSNASITRGNYLHITIIADSGSTHMQLDIDKYTGAGTYSLNDSGTGNGATYTEKGNVHKATSGQIVVTNSYSSSNTKTGIKGTFQFLADTVTVTNGLFDATLNLD